MGTLESDALLLLLVVVVVVVVVLDAIFQAECSMSTNAEDKIVQEPSMAKNPSPSKAPKNGTQRQCELTEHEKSNISRRKNHHRRHKSCSLK